MNFSTTPRLLNCPVIQIKCENYFISIKLVIMIANIFGTFSPINNNQQKFRQTLWLMYIVQQQQQQKIKIFSVYSIRIDNPQQVTMSKFAILWFFLLNNQQGNKSLVTSPHSLVYQYFSWWIRNTNVIFKLFKLGLTWAYYINNLIINICKS